MGKVSNKVTRALLKMNWPRVKEGLTKSEAYVYAWRHELLGSFSLALAEVIAKADNSNREKLALGFPIEVLGILYFQEVAGWWEEVEEQVQKLAVEQEEER